MRVYSDKNRKPRYYVTTVEGKLLFESDDAASTIQWAVDHTNENVVCSGTFKLKSGSRIRGKERTSGK